MRARGALPGGRGAALQRQDRLAPGHPPGEPAEPARVPERLDVEQHDVRRGVVLPPLEQVVRGDVGLVPDRDEGGEPEAAGVGRLEQRQPERAGLRGEADVPRRRGAGGKRRVQPRCGDGDPEAVGPDQPGAVCADECEQLLLPRRSLAPDLCEAGGDDHERADAVAQRVLDSAQDVLSRHRDHGEIDRIGDRRDRCVAADAGDGRSLRVDGVGGAGEVGLEDIAEELAADRAAPRRRADDGDARRLEERPQRCHNGGVVALLDAALEPLGRGDRKLDLDDAARELPLQLEPGALEDAQHRAVVREHLGDEAFDPDLGGPRGQTLQQPGADPASLFGIGDGERRLRERRVAQADVVADRDDPLAVVVGQRSQQRPALRPVGVEQRLDELAAEVRQPVEAPVQALLRKGAVEGEQRVGIGGRRRPEAQRPAVPEDHVHGLSDRHRPH